VNVEWGWVGDQDARTGEITRSNAGTCQNPAALIRGEHDADQSPARLRPSIGSFAFRNNVKNVKEQAGRYGNWR